MDASRPRKDQEVITSSGEGGLFPRIADFLIYSNLFIACCAAGFVLSAYPLMGLEVRWDGLTALSFGGTLALYLALRLHSARQLRGKEFTERLVWVDRNRTVSWFLFFAGAGIGLWGLLSCDQAVWLALLPAAVLALLYGLPFLPLPLAYRLRQRNYLKIFLIAGVWAWMASIMPAVQADLGWEHAPAWLLFGCRFLFVVGITLPFDIRDIETDRVFHLATLPMALGVARSILLARILLFVSLVLLCWLTGPDVLWMALSMLYVFTIWSVGFSATTRNEYLYLGWLDGTMLLQYPVVVLVELLLR